ncbi:MAG TPA: hypothetical protein VGZ29_08090 [Terriglobia bacterium]|nr:hypothetical protein [Terriglobia bacterium]
MIRGRITVVPASAISVLALLFSGAPAAAQGQDSFRQIFVERYLADDAAIPPGVRRELAAPLRRMVRDSAGTPWEAESGGLAEGAVPRRKLWTAGDGLPYPKLDGVAAARCPPGAANPDCLWLASHQGAMLFVPSAPPGQRWYLFAGRRYLAGDVVLGLVPDSSGAWIRTRRGVSRIAFRPYTLEQKAGYFEDRLARRHLRDGFVDDCHMASPGDSAACRPEPSDNDGLWTAIYVAAECFRYASTGSPEALARARASLDAMLRLESVTGMPGFPARAIAAPGEDRDPAGEWHPAGNGRFWKGDTSSDELVGHFFAGWIAYNLLPAGSNPGSPPDNEVRGRVAAEAGRIAQRLLDNGLRLVGPGGRMTRWGNYTAQYFKTPEGAEDAGLDSLEILSHLRVASRMGGQPWLDSAYRHVAFDLGYLDYVSRLARPPGEVNYSDEELAYLAFAPLLDPLPRSPSNRGTGAEDDPAPAARYRATLRRFWRRTHDENNPLWAVIAAAALPGEVDLRAARESLERIPMDTVEWTVRNSDRADITPRTRSNRFGRPQSTRALPANERQVMKWNGDPFELDGGDGGRSEDDGAFFLLPYWMARYYGLIGPKAGDCDAHHPRDKTQRRVTEEG